MSHSVNNGLIRNRAVCKRMWVCGLLWVLTQQETIIRLTHPRNNLSIEGENISVTDLIQAVQSYSVSHPLMSDKWTNMDYNTQLINTPCLKANQHGLYLLIKLLSCWWCTLQSSVSTVTTTQIWLLDDFAVCASVIPTGGRAHNNTTHPAHADPAPSKTTNT